MASGTDCPFCDIINGEAEAEVISDGIHSMEIVPLNPVTEGHTIFIPKQHRSDALSDPKVTATLMHDAAAWTRLRRGEGSFNFITSVGTPATQSVFHLHVHAVPRSENDGLALPWYSGKSKRKH
jgi:histidine triad (HIT) family protein